MLPGEDLPRIFGRTVTSQAMRAGVAVDGLMLRKYTRWRMTTLFSGIQPPGEFHPGNCPGAVRGRVELQDSQHRDSSLHHATLPGNAPHIVRVSDIRARGGVKARAAGSRAMAGAHGERGR